MATVASVESVAFLFRNRNAEAEASPAEVPLPAFEEWASPELKAHAPKLPEARGHGRDGTRSLGALQVGCFRHRVGVA